MYGEQYSECMLMLGCKVLNSSKLQEALNKNIYYHDWYKPFLVLCNYIFNTFNSQKWLICNLSL